MDLDTLALSLPRLKPVNGRKLTIQKTQAGIAFPAKTDHFAFIPPSLAGLPFFAIAAFWPLAAPLPALPIAMPLPALSLYTGNPITA